MTGAASCQEAVAVSVAAEPQIDGVNREPARRVKRNIVDGPWRAPSPLFLKHIGASAVAGSLKRMAPLMHLIRW
jgi:hypothetical protein